MSQANPTREDFEALLAESFATNDLAEGYVVKGRIVAIEKDMAIIDAGLKVEGRVPLKEFGAKAKDGSLKAKQFCRVKRLAAKKAGSVWKRSSTAANASTVSSSIRSRVASPSISTAPSPSCRARRSTSARSATSPR